MKMHDSLKSKHKRVLDGIERCKNVNKKQIMELQNELTQFQQEIEQCESETSDRIDTTSFICDRVSYYSDQHKVQANSLSNIVNKVSLNVH